MLSRSILISEDEFKELSPIVGNYEYDFIKPFVIIAQDIDISQSIGERQLERLHQGVIDDNLTGDETRLLEQYVAPALVHYAMFRGLTFLLFKPDNSGLVKRNSENGTSAELGEASFLADSEKTSAESYDKRLRRYIEANAELYPLYKTEVLGQISPSDAPSYSGGLWIGKKANLCVTDKPAPTYHIPVVDFYADRLEINAGESVSFYYTGTDNANGYEWNFNNSQFSDEKHPTIIFDTPGTYTIVCKATNIAGIGAKRKRNYITVI